MTNPLTTAVEASTWPFRDPEAPSPNARWFDSAFGSAVDSLPALPTRSPELTGVSFGAAIIGAHRPKAVFHEPNARQCLVEIVYESAFPTEKLEWSVAFNLYSDPIFQLQTITFGFVVGWWHLDPSQALARFRVDPSITRIHTRRGVA